MGSGVAGPRGQISYLPVYLRIWLASWRLVSFPAHSARPGAPDTTIALGRRHLGASRRQTNKPTH